MRTVALVLLLSFALVACGEGGCGLCGHWRSHEARTLQEMERSSALSKEQKQLYRDDFFGRLVVETTPTQARAFFPDEHPDSIPWAAWELVESNGNNYVTRLTDPDSGEWIEKNVRLEGECYRVEQPGLGFGEWFCRLPR